MLGDLKNEDILKNEDEPKNKDNLKNEYNFKKKTSKITTALNKKTNSKSKATTTINTVSKIKTT